MGCARARQPRLMGKAHPRRISGRIVVAHHLVQARGISPCVCRFRSRHGGGVYPADVARLLQDAGIIRSRQKIEAAIGNARAWLAMQAAGEDFGVWCWDFVQGQPLQNSGPVPAQTELSVTISKALKKNAASSLSGRWWCMHGCRRSAWSMTTPPTAFAATAHAQRRLRADVARRRIRSPCR